MSDEQIEDLQAEELTPALYGEDELAALRFAGAMTVRSTDVPASVHREVRRRWTEEEVVEIASVAGIFNYFNRFNNALEVPPTEPSPHVE